MTQNQCSLDCFKANSVRGRRAANAIIDHSNVEFGPLRSRSAPGKKISCHDTRSEFLFFLANRSFLFNCETSCSSLYFLSDAGGKILLLDPPVNLEKNSNENKEELITHQNTCVPQQSLSSYLWHFWRLINLLLCILQVGTLRACSNWRARRNSNTSQKAGRCVTGFKQRTPGSRRSAQSSAQRIIGTDRCQTEFGIWNCRLPTPAWSPGFTDQRCETVKGHYLGLITGNVQAKRVTCSCPFVQYVAYNRLRTKSIDKNW